MIDSKALGRAAAVLTAALVLGASVGTADAHHSFAGYEQELQLKIKGTVADFQWTNPHVYIRLDAPNAKGETDHWLIECANPGILNRVGWKWNMIKAGDEITVIIAPLRSGEPGALLKAVKLADGREFDNGGPAGPATISFDD